MKTTRGTRLRWIACGALAGATAAGACVDTFHSTDFQPCTSCVDAGAAETEASAPASVDLSVCPPFSGDAKAAARRACAWIGACAGPLGASAYGECYFDALQMFDCNVRPGRRPLGAAKEFWECVYRRTKDTPSCDAVTTCFPRATCPAVVPVDTTACDERAGLRVLCFADGKKAPLFEYCPAAGRRCSAALGECALSDQKACAASACEGTVSHVCNATADGGTEDIGVDCKYFGAGSCGPAGCRFTDRDRTLCSQPVVDDGGPADAITCSAGTATMCPAGQKESINCDALGFGCVGQAAAPGAFDVSIACKPQGAGGCAPKCVGTSLTSCFRGQPFVVDCKDQGLGCKEVPVPGGTTFTCAL